MKRPAGDFRSYPVCPAGVQLAHAARTYVHLEFRFFFLIDNVDPMKKAQVPLHVAVVSNAPLDFAYSVSSSQHRLSTWSRVGRSPVQSSKPGILDRKQSKQQLAAAFCSQPLAMPAV